MEEERPGFRISRRGHVISLRGYVEVEREPLVHVEEGFVLVGLGRRGQ